MRAKLMILKAIHDAVVNQFEETIGAGRIKTGPLADAKQAMREAQKHIREFLIQTEADNA